MRSRRDAPEGTSAPPSLGWSAERIEDTQRTRHSGFYLQACEVVRRSAAIQLHAEGGYAPVARIAGRTLDAAYTLTNHGDAAWHETDDDR